MSNGRILNNQPIILNVPMCDYLRVTTWDWETYVSIATEVVHAMHGDLGRPGRVMQYEGNSYAHGFHGQGEQNGRPHYLAQLSGMFADELYQPVTSHKPVVTRVDYQITIEKPTWYDARKFCDKLRAEPWPNRRRKITLIDGGGDDTVYIGSRTSDRFIRIYVKHERYLRYEVEYKGERARRAVYLANGTGKAALLSGELAKMPQTDTVLKFVAALDAAGVDVKVTIADPDIERKVAWLRSLIPTIRKMANDHDHGGTIRAWLEDILTEDMG